MNDDVQLGHPDSILMLAREHGLNVSQKLSLSPLSKEQEPVVVRSYTLKLMSNLKELTSIKESLEEVRYKMTCVLLDQGSKDLLHVASLDHKQRQLDDLMSYFSKVVENMDTLVTQLQKDVNTSTSLAIERKYHKDVYESLSILTNFFNKLSHYNELIDALKVYHFKSDVQKVNPLSRSQQLLVDCKLDTQRLQNHFNCRPL